MTSSAEDALQRTGKKPESMHLLEHLVAALKNLEGEGVKIVHEDDSLRYSNCSFIRECEIQITLMPSTIYSDRENRYWPLRLERALDKLGVHYPRRLRNKVAYRKDVVSPTLERVGHLLSKYQSIGCPVEINDGVSILFTKDIRGVNPIRERVLVYTLPPS